MRRALAGNGGAAAILVTPMVALLIFLLTDVVAERIAATPRFRVSSAYFDVRGAPDHLPSGFARSIGDFPVLDRPRSILDPELPGIVRARLEAHPWVRRVVEVRRRFPNLIDLDVQLRRALGVFRVEGERLALDGEGVVLEEHTRLAPPRLPWITTPGAPISFVPTRGHRFAAGGAVQEALGVLEELDRVADHPALHHLRLREVCVGRAGRPRQVGDSDIRLVFDTGVEVLWGRSPRSAAGIMEIPASTKLDHLARVQRTWPGLVSVKLVDLRFERPEVQRTTAPGGAPGGG